MIMRIAVLTIKISILIAYFYLNDYLKILSVFDVSKNGYKKRNVSENVSKIKMDTKMDTKKTMYPKMDTSMFNLLM